MNPEDTLLPATSSLRNVIGTESYDHHLKQAKGGTVCGLPVESFSREDLMAAMHLVANHARTDGTHKPEAKPSSYDLDLSRILEPRTTHRRSPATP